MTRLQALLALHALAVQWSEHRANSEDATREEMDAIAAIMDGAAPAIQREAILALTELSARRDALLNSTMRPETTAALESVEAQIDEARDVKRRFAKVQS